MTTTKTTTPSKPTVSVEEAERVLADLEAKRVRLDAQRVKDDEEMSRVSFQAHALHEAGASTTLREISERAIERDQRQRSLDCAIAEAKQRLVAAQAAEHAKAERVRAKQVRAAVARLKVAGQTIDDALEVLVAAGEEIHTVTDELHALDCATPSGQQVLSFGERAIRSAVQQTLWARCIERLSSTEKTTFSHVISQWETAIMRHLGETERTEKEVA